VFLIGEKVEEAAYNPAFGQVIKNSKQAKELARQRGMVECGSEPVGSMFKAEETATKAKQASWDNV